MSEIYAAIEKMSETQLDELLQAIKDKLEDLRGERPEVNVGDVVGVPSIISPFIPNTLLFDG